MTYARFEDVPVWQEAARLYEAAEDLLENESFPASRGYRDQLDRAALSVSNNIAEGFDRGTNPDLLNFLYISRGSTGEVRSMLCMLEKMVAFRNQESGIRNLKLQTESISKQLGGWVRSLRDSDLKGERYVSEKTRQADMARRGRDEFLKELEQIRNGGART